LRLYGKRGATDGPTVAQKRTATVCSPSMVLSFRFSLPGFVMLFFTTLGLAQQPFLPSEQWVKLRDEASGAAPYENLRYLTRLNRVPATAEFDQAPDFML